MEYIHQLFKSLLQGDEFAFEDANYEISRIIDRYGCIHIGHDTIGFIKDVIRHESGHIRMAIATHLSSLNNKGESFIEEMATHLYRWSSDEESTSFVLLSLAELGEKASSAKDAVCTCLKHPNPHIRYRAIITLGDICGFNESVFIAIARMLKNEQEPFVVFAGIGVLMSSRFKNEFKQICLLLAYSFYEKMNASEQVVISHLLDTGEWGRGEWGHSSLTES